MEEHERPHAAIAALRQVRRDMEIAEDIAARPRCQDCRFGPVRSTDPDKCEHFVHWQISPDRRLRIPVSTAQARSKDGLCGPEGLLFKPYIWWRLVPRWLARRKGGDAVWYMWLGIMGALSLVLALFGR